MEEKAKEPAKDGAKEFASHSAVPTFTGEENESTLFDGYAKLYEFDNATKNWTERGVGQFRINHLKDEAKQVYRLLMRTQTTLKLILNSPLFASMTALPMDKQPTCIKFTAIPIPGSTVKGADEAGEAAVEANHANPGIALFNVRFKTAETAALALKTINDALSAKAKQGGAPSPVKSAQPASSASTASPAAASAQSNNQNAPAIVEDKAASEKATAAVEASSSSSS